MVTVFDELYEVLACNTIFPHFHILIGSRFNDNLFRLVNPPTLNVNLFKGDYDNSLNWQSWSVLIPTESEPARIANVEKNAETISATKVVAA